MSYTILNALATPEAENAAFAAGGASRLREIARELSITVDEMVPVDWEKMIDAGGGPGLALGAERRVRR